VEALALLSTALKMEATRVPLKRRLHTRTKARIGTGSSTQMMSNTFAFTYIQPSVKLLWL
jgi:hypothetical protein